MQGIYSSFSIYLGITITEIKRCQESFVKCEINSIGSAIRIYIERTISKGYDCLKGLVEEKKSELGLKALQFWLKVRMCPRSEGRPLWLE